MTIWSSGSTASWCLILSNPISWTVLPLISIRSSANDFDLESSDAYFSLNAPRKLCGLSVGRDGRTNEAAVGPFSWPG